MPFEAHPGVIGDLNAALAARDRDERLLAATKRDLGLHRSNLHHLARKLGLR